MFTTFCVLLLTAATGTAQDLQFWNEIDFASAWRGVAITMPVVLRTDSSLPNPQFIASGVTADVRLPWHITMSGGYLVVDLPQRVPSLVRVPLVAASGAFRLRRLVGADRNPLEKLSGVGVSPVRYRNRFLLDLALDHRSVWHAFGDDEVFFDRSTSTWTQNRLRVGRRLSARILLDAYYLRRSVSGGASTHVAGTTVRVRLTDVPRQRGEP